ncbi:MAG: GAF domain-containing protein [Bacteroidales bacterium]|nr:GAF domain-containing protein [Bacteroidales bacterium]
MNRQGKKIALYNRIYKQLQEMLSDNPDVISRLATINAILYHKIPYFFWVGFYILHEDNLYVGPYQGPLACQVLPYHKGMCWKCVTGKKTIIVDNVHEMKDHIACDARSKSEIVVPVFDEYKNVIAVLDVDSDSPQAFDNQDDKGLTQITELIRW